MNRFCVLLHVLPLVLAANPACAQDGVQNVAFFYPLRTRRPVIERELEVRVENEVMVWQSLDWLSQVAVGVEARLPTGAERRGLGGEAAIEPFVSGGIALGDFDLLAAVAYEFNVNAHVPGPNEQELTASAAVGWRVSQRFTPLLELVTVTRTRGASDDELLHRTRVSLVPGFNARVLPRSTFRFGVELPLTRARAADYTLLGGFVKEF